MVTPSLKTRHKTYPMSVGLFRTCRTQERYLAPAISPSIKEPRLIVAGDLAPRVSSVTQSHTLHLPELSHTRSIYVTATKPKEKNCLHRKLFY
ncbi:hypothetical protein EVAR_62213_1 [Eumeta japonica]|uniref:Uncharacterized protein n=1 Tax=Eumeta variegata TaxID=151549 RepID=A0A4C1ZG28_EUMVA|nr:hypothetical protein EVAR_62213_1 [Eumeta japonica]